MKTKLLMRIFSVLFAFTCLSASATTDVWTFDKTPVSGQNQKWLTSDNYSDYLPEGWYAPSSTWAFSILPQNGKQYLLSGVNSGFESKFQPFYAHGGSLKLEMLTRYGNSISSEFYIWKATKSGDSFTLGDVVVNTNVDVDGTVKELTYDLPEDGYYALSFYSGVMLASVSNTYEPASSMVSDVWTFDKAEPTGAGWVNSGNYTTYLPDGWYAPNYNWNFQIVKDGDTQVLKSGIGVDLLSERYQPLYAHGGSITFKMKKANTVTDTEFYLWKANKNGDSFTLGEKIVNETLSLGQDAWTESTFALPEDGYYAFSVVTGTMILSVTNTYEGAAVTYTVSGTVVDEAGAPVADVNVAVGSASAVTDAEGKYTIPGLADGTYDLVASKSGYENATASVTVSGADVTVDPITLSAVKWYLGGYVQNSNYQHVAGVAMQLYLGEELVGETTSDSEGNYRIAIPAEEKTYTLKMQAEYYKDYTSAVSVRESYLNADKVRTFNPYIEAKLVSFNLTVKDTWNQPVNGADVTINGENLANVKVYESGNTGVYVLRNKRAGDLKDNEYTWTVTAEGYDVATGTVVFNGNDVNRSVTLIPTGTTVISGTVTDAEGKAISGAHVSLTIGAAAVPAASIDTNAEGFYSFARNDLEGSATVEVETDYYGSETKEVTVIMPNANNVCDFTLTELVYTYTATVKNQAGDFLAGATVVFDGTALTGENGVFSTSMKAKDAAGREIPVEITCEGYQTQTFSVMLNRDINETYTLRKAEVAKTDVQITVQNKESAGIEDADVRIYSDDIEVEVENWGQGDYFASIPTDANMGKTFTVEVKATDYKDYTTTFELGASEIDLVVVLEKSDGDGVEGILDDIDGDTVIFTVDGLRVEVKEGATLPAGLYIVNGKKLVVR